MMSDTTLDALLLALPVVIVIVVFVLLKLRMARGKAPEAPAEDEGVDDSLREATRRAEMVPDANEDARPAEEPPELAAAREPDTAEVEKALQDLEKVSDQILAEKVDKASRRSRPRNPK